MAIQHRIDDRIDGPTSAARLRGASELIDAFDGPIGAYVHVPFCSWICPFCPYDKVLTRPGDPAPQRYFAALDRELDAAVEALLRSGRTAFTSLYLGGGTPTLFPDRLARIVSRLPVEGERAVEVLPTHATPSGLDRLRDSGFTAVSIGAQSFHDPVLRRLRRPHSAAQARAAVRQAIGRFDCVDVDLIVDVAWDRDPALAGAFLDDVRACFDAGVDQVSTYPLMRFGYTPFGTARHDRRREHEVLAEVSRFAAAAGYEQRSVWTFDRIGSAPYTSITRRRFVGLGAGAASYAGRDLFVNHFGLQQYDTAIAAGRMPVARRLHLGRAFGAAYDVFWQAYAGGIDLAGLSKSYGPAVGRGVDLLCRMPAATGMLHAVPGGYRLTPKGFDVYHDLERWVTYQLIEPLWAEMLAEHGTLAARWAVPERGRRGLVWRLAKRAFERRAPRSPHVDQGKNCSAR